MDCRSASAADCVRDCGLGVQWPNERKPIFFMQHKSSGDRRQGRLRSRNHRTFASSCAIVGRGSRILSVLAGLASEFYYEASYSATGLRLADGLDRIHREAPQTFFLVCQQLSSYAHQSRGSAEPLGCTCKTPSRGVNSFVKTEHTTQKSLAQRRPIS